MKSKSELKTKRKGKRKMGWIIFLIIIAVLGGFPMQQLKINQKPSHPAKGREGYILTRYHPSLLL